AVGLPRHPERVLPPVGRGAGLQLRLLAAPADHRAADHPGLRHPGGVLMRAPLLALAALAVAGCTDFDPASLVNGLRVLGIKADPPEIPWGAPAMLHALVVTPPNSDAGAPSLEWAACHRAPVPSSGLAVNPDCLTSDSADFLEPLGSGDTVTV